MQKLITGLAAGAALVLLGSIGQACDFHKSHVTASVPPQEEGVAMSTYDGPPPPIVVADESAPASTQECAADAKDCVSVSE